MGKEGAVHLCTACSKCLCPPKLREWYQTYVLSSRMPCAVALLQTGWDLHFGNGAALEVVRNQASPALQSSHLSVLLKKKKKFVATVVSQMLFCKLLFQYSLRAASFVPGWRKKGSSREHDSH